MTKNVWRTLVAVLVSVVCVLPQAATAQEVDLQLTPGQVHAAFATRGFAVEDPITWSWTSPPVTSFRVHDTPRDRVLLVLVYPDRATARAERLSTQADGAWLVPGYGPSSWWQNVALVESSASELHRQFGIELEWESGMGRNPLAPPVETYRHWEIRPVSAEFLGALLQQQPDRV